MKEGWISGKPARISAEHAAAAKQRQSLLTKPPGALGALENLAIRLAGMQASFTPTIANVRIVVFAADHGVAAEGVSAFPQAVTVEMLRNFARGGAAINVLARELAADLEVVDVGTVSDGGVLSGVIRQRAGAGTANFVDGAAMTEAQLQLALAAGLQAAERAAASAVQLFVGGEMGIGNTTSAAALACALLNREPAAIAGPGTGLDAQGVRRKIAVVERALALHQTDRAEAYDALRCLGGFEIAALVAAYIACAQRGMPVLVDGFIASIAALTAVRLNPGCADWFIYGHLSAEPAHCVVLRALDAEPLVNLGMRLGEGSGAAVAVPILRLACALHNSMATFAEAAVSPKR
jgi:nicotinate-nucleotide--dimethylbenzimidazole phosphoribosyltransferase